MANVKFEGGRKLQKLLRKAGKGGVSSVDVGVFDTAKYPDGTPVAQVYATQEFGSNKAGRGHSVEIPERPTFRPAIHSVQPKLVQLIKDNVDPKKMVIEANLAGRLGVAFENEIKRNITDLKSPANSPVTIALKGSSNPLVDTSTMRNSISYEVKQ